MLNKDVFTLRIPEEKNKSIKKLSMDIGISQNNLILLFIDLGLKSVSDIIVRQKEEFLRLFSQNQK